MLEHIQSLRDGLHARAFHLHSRGLNEAAQAVWAVVEELDDLINRTEPHGKP